MAGAARAAVRSTSPCAGCRARDVPGPRPPVPGRRSRSADVVAAVERLAPRGGAGVRILLWHVHGSWTTAFVHGPHEYVVPVVPDRGPDGRRARAHVRLAGHASRGHAGASCADERRRRRGPAAPARARAARAGVAGAAGATCPPSTSSTTRRRAGSPRCATRPPTGRTSLLVHVTHFNALFWDAGTTPTRVIEHGIVDPGQRYTGELPRAAVVINEARRRGRVTGTDLLDRFAARGPARPVRDRRRRALGGIEDLPQAELHGAMARRRVYLHPIRWTSLGLSLLEAMQLGMPVVALGHDRGARGRARRGRRGVHPARRARRRDAPAHRRSRRGARARRAPPAPPRSTATACERFLADWDELLEEVAR